MGRTIRLIGVIASFVFAVGLAACGGDDDGKEALNPQQITQRSSPSVVRLQGNQGPNAVVGTGVVFDRKEGLALTNAHVVSGVTGLKATVLDDKEIPARVLATAPCDDLAVVELSSVPSGMTQMPLGRTKALKSGATVTALGYPESIEESSEQSVVSTTGNVSSVDVSTEIDPTLPKYPSLIQHQATINPGNSGGPLVNKYGELVGINTLGYQGAGGEVQNQSYAITVDHVKGLLPDLRAGRSYADLGWDLAPVSLLDSAEYETTVDAATVARFLEQEDYSEELFVRAVSPGSPVNKASIHFGDLIEVINGTPVQTVGEVCDVVQSAAPGSALRIEGHYFYARPDVLASKFGENLRWHTKVRVPEDSK